MWNFTKLDTTPLNSPLSLFSAPCHPQTVKYRNENPLPCHPFPLKLLPTCENIGLRSHLHPTPPPAATTRSLLPHHTPFLRAPDSPPTTPTATLTATPQTLPPATPHPQPHPTPDIPPTPPSSAPTLPPNPQPHPTPKSHVIPPGPHSPIARKPRNINDPISNSETYSRELRAKLLSTCHGSTSRSPPRPGCNTSG